MKKKLLSILLIGTMCVSLSGCGVFSIVKNLAKNDEQSPAPGASGAATVSTAPAPSPSVEAEPTASPDVDVAEGTSQYTPGLQRENLITGVKKAYVVEEDFSMTEYLEVLKGETIIGADAKDGEAYVMTTDGSDSYIGKYLYYLRGQNDYERYEIPEEFSNSADKSHLIIRDGKLYFAYYDEGSDQSWLVSICKCDGNTGKFVKDVALTDALRKSEEEVEKGNYLHSNIAYDLEKTGYFYRNDYFGKIVRFNEDGSKASEAQANGEMSNFSSVVTVENDEALVLCYETDSNRVSRIGYYFMDLDTGLTTKFISVEGYGGINIIGMDEDYMYFYNREDNDMGYAPAFEFCRKSLEQDSEPETILFIEGSHDNEDSGLWAINGLGGTVTRGHLFNLCVSEDSMGWEITNALDLDEAPNMGPLEYPIEYKKFGEIKSMYDSYEDTVGGGEDENGQPIEEKSIKFYERYAEYFTFNDDVPNAAKMNEVLSEWDWEFDQNCEGTLESAHDDIIDNYDPEYSDYIFTYSNYRGFKSVEQIGSHYIQLGIGVYDYWGGAHGMGGTYYSLFDTNTGRLCPFRNIYPGGDESFKKLVTAYTIANWKEDDEPYYTYYDPTEPELESQFRATVEQYLDDMDTMNIRLLEDGFEVLWDPYVLGPYASGYIPVYIPYADAGIDLSK